MWWEKPLERLTQVQWERLCDGCARCCMHRFEDEESGAIMDTAIACAFLDVATARCTCYEQRRERQPRCLDVRALAPEDWRWLPETCAYRLRAAGLPLPEWHPLRTGGPEAMEAAGVSMRGRCVSEREVDSPLLD